MSTQHARQFSRRRFLGGLTLVGTAGLLNLPPRSVAAEPPPETTSIRLFDPGRGVCTVVPQLIAEELLKAEGFTDVQYVQVGSGLDFTKLIAGDVDLAMRFVGSVIVQLDAGEPVLLLAGVHIGCYELFASDRIRSLRDLKGKKVGVPSLQDSRRLFVASAASYVGLDPHQEIDWVAQPTAESIQLFAEGRLDAFLGFPPEPQDLRARKIGHVLLNTAVDRPWSQYFCCMLVASPKFVRAHPVATKRAVRAMLKAADVCALDPERGARLVVEKDLTLRYDYALQAIRELPYNKWREYDAEDTVRFYALRLHEAGMIKSSPQKIIAQGTDWRFLNALKKELKD
jgi:NitT/TauT family transport system substrate-binding protein